MAYKLFDYVNHKGENEIKAWTSKLEKAFRAKLNNRLDNLVTHGDELFPEILTGTDTAGILKLRIKGNIQYRPMLCRGPISSGDEYTLLLGCKEKGDKLVPPKADEIADDKKNKVIGNPLERRIDHERVN